MSETEDTDWRSTMYAPKDDDRTATGPIGIRPDQHTVVPSLSYVQRLERLVIEMGSRLSEAERKISRLEMHNRTTRDAVRKNAAVLTDIARDVDGKLDAP